MLPGGAAPLYILAKIFPEYMKGEENSKIGILNGQGIIVAFYIAFRHGVR